MQHDPVEEVQHARDARRGAAALLRDCLADLEARWRQIHATESEEAAPRQSPEAVLGDIIDRLDERAFGLLLLLLALPCCLPFVYVLPQIVALPMLALAGQMAAGRESPWLPQAMRARRFEIAQFRSVLDRSEKYVRWIERAARPRLAPLTDRFGARVIGVLLFVPILSILTPLPGTNTIPGIGVAIAALGLIERDGYLTIAGLLIGWIWVALLLIFGLEAASVIKDFLVSAF